MSNIAKVTTKADKKLKTSKIESQKTDLVKKVTPRNKTNLVEEVVSNREVKYIYPDDVVDTLSRKSWRQKVRDKINTLKLELLDIKDQNSKEYKKALKALNDYQKTVLK